MHVTIVIVGFRNAADIERCLSALDGATYSDFDVVIVENGGSAAFTALRTVIPRELAGGRTVTLVEAPGNLGFAGGVNLGIAHRRDADAWWILNPDTVPETSALAALVTRLQKGDCEAVGGVLHFADGRVQSIGGHWQGWWARATSIGADSHVEDAIDVAAVEEKLDYLVGASALVGRTFFETVGPMREDYFLYAEEIEWFLRGGQHGMKLGLAPGARVLHHQGTTTGWSNSVRGRPKLPIYLDERNRLLLTRDRFPARVPVVAVTALLFMLLRFGRKRAWKQIGFGVQGWAAGLMGKRGVPRWHRA